MLKKKEQLELTEVLRRDFTKDVVDITISLSNLQNVLDDTVKSILAGIQAKIAKKQFDIEEYSKAVNRVEDIKEEVEDLKFLLNCTDEEKNEWKKRNLQDLPVFKRKQ